MITVLTNARVLTLANGMPLGARRGEAMKWLGIIDPGEVWIDDVSGTIVKLGQADECGPIPEGAEYIDCRGRVLMPGFIDCHTHACFEGDRLQEWELKLAGATYLEIAARGGGIMRTVTAVHASSEGDLAAGLSERLRHILAEGTTTVEVKSGYGLSMNYELMMLHAIARAGHVPSIPLPNPDKQERRRLRDAAKNELPKLGITVIPTALIGHTIDSGEYGEFGDGDEGAEKFIQHTINETLPAVSAEFPGITIDAFCEKTAWSRAQCQRLFKAAAQRGHPCRVHVDQFNELGLLEDVNTLDLRSVDHLEATSDDSLERLAKTNAIGVLLPCAGFHTDGRYANGRKLIDSGGAVALATNYNPGSAPCFSMPMAIALAVRHCGLTPAEAICACTVNAAAVLDLKDRGIIFPGLRADLVVLRHDDERMLAYEFGGRHVDMVFCAGSRVG